MSLKCTSLFFLVLTSGWTSALDEGDPIVTLNDIDLSLESPSFLIQHSIPLEVKWISSYSGGQFSHLHGIPAGSPIRLQDPSDQRFVKVEAPSAVEGVVIRPFVNYDAKEPRVRGSLRIHISKWTQAAFSSVTFTAIPKSYSITHAKYDSEIRLAFHMTNATLEGKSAFFLQYPNQHVITDLTSTFAKDPGEVGDFATCAVVRADENDGNVDVDLRCMVSGLAVGDRISYNLGLQGLINQKVEFIFSSSVFVSRFP
ncbi:hypothetical protein CAPTEDRAFT_216206 [Capitella teleta]|uniref:Uncharacterized protein n=1 Tax=Capitella teleta TaxID=283909 RepID=R7VCS3_CAPTE|nr:hypothetical protein CAPTEDRAFT_216206 [Capitella teleta]|eukprot:ELU13480.1 hypothetical protein CAPTEDRAFT_216206 [Capitella teleta]